MTEEDRLGREALVQVIANNAVKPAHILGAVVQYVLLAGDERERALAQAVDRLVAERVRARQQGTKQ